MSEALRIEKNDTKGASVTKEWKEGDMNYTLTVEQVEGGFIITECKHGYADEKKEKYISESKKKVTTENPLQDLNEDKGLFSFVKDIFID